MLLGASTASAGVVDRVAAVVDNEVIAISEVYELGSQYIQERCPMRQKVCVRDMELEVLDALIKRVLIRSELNNLGMRVSGQDIDQAIDQVVRDNGMLDRQQLRQEVEAQGLRWDAFRDDMADRMRVQRFQQGVLMPRVVISEDEVRDIYKRTERSSRAEEVNLDAFGMLIPAEADEEQEAEVLSKAAELVAGLKAEELEWDAVVEEHDQAQLASVVGGRSYAEGQLNETVDQAAFAAKVGDIVGPVQVGKVLFVLRINSRGLGESRVIPFEEIAEQLRNQLFQEKLMEAEDEWYQRARRLSSVEVLIEDTEE